MYALERQNILIPTYGPIIDASKKNWKYFQYLWLVARSAESVAPIPRMVDDNIREEAVIPASQHFLRLKVPL